VKINETEKVYKYDVYVREYDQIISKFTVDYIKHALIRDCQPYLNAVKSNDFLVRAMRYSVGGFSKLTPDENRKPKDSSPDFQKYVDLLLTNKGFTALRRNSFFAGVTRFSDLGYFGSFRYNLYPIGPLEYTWNTRFKDLMDLYQDYYHAFYNIERETLMTYSRGYAGSAGYDVFLKHINDIDWLKGNDYWFKIKSRLIRFNGLYDGKTFNLENFISVFGDTFRNDNLESIPESHEVWVKNPCYFLAADMAGHIEDLFS
jgi:hypothetical protein